MRIVIAPDKFKGSLTASEAAAAIREGFEAVFPGAEFDFAPIADGGEGTGAILHEALGGETVHARTHDALDRSITASYLWFPKRKLAVIEMSAASGLWRLNAKERNPLAATTFGTGKLMADAVARGAESIVVALGGSATNDAGLGMARALGWRFFDATENEMSPRPANFLLIRRVSPPLQPFPARVTALCDVSNPLLGPAGATAVYGPQKGVTPETAETLEQALDHAANLVEAVREKTFRAIPGAGAAGGLGFGLMAFCDAALESGFEAVSGVLDLDARIARADLVITGEGKLDAQSQHGKGPVEVAKLAKRHGKPILAFAGVIEGANPGIDVCLPICDAAMSPAESHERAAELLRGAAERAARLLKISI